MNTQEKAYNNAIGSCRNALYNSGIQNQSKAMRTVNNLFSKYRTKETANEDGTYTTAKAGGADTANISNTNSAGSAFDTATIGLQLKQAVDSIFDPTTGMSDEQKKRFVEKLYKKLESGKKLSADELQYLRMNDPVTYAKAARVQMMRESFKKQLESAKSKEQAADMYLQNMSRIADDDPAKKGLEAAYNDVYSQFKKTEAYKKLPDTEKEAKEEKAKKNGNKDNTKVEWEEDKEENSEINEIPLDDF